MDMLILDATNESVAVTVNAVPSKALDYTAHWADVSSSAMVETNADGTLTSGTTTIIPSPTGTHSFIVREITIQNNNAASIPLYVALVDNGNQPNHLVWNPCSK